MNKEFKKFVLELVTQEYNGRLFDLRATCDSNNLKLTNEFEVF